MPASNDNCYKALKTSVLRGFSAFALDRGFGKNSAFAQLPLVKQEEARSGAANVSFLP